MLSHRDLCILVTKWATEQPWCQLATYEIRYNRGFADVLAISLKDRLVHKRICCIEVKRTRSDLLADLRAQKLLRYEKGSTHCILACTREALSLDKMSLQESITELTSLGLPLKWGILLIEDQKLVRAARAISPFNQIRQRTLIKKIGRSCMHRMLYGTTISDTEEEC